MVSITSEGISKDTYSKAFGRLFVLSVLLACVASVSGSQALAFGASNSNSAQLCILFAIGMGLLCVCAMVLAAANYVLSYQSQR